MKRKEEMIYSELQDEKYKLEKILRNIKKLDSELGAKSDQETFDGEIMPMIEEVFTNLELS